METKRNEKYFTSTGPSVLFLVGAGITLFGIILLFVRQTQIAGILILLAGLTVIAFSSGGKSNEGDIDYQVSEKIKEIGEEAQKKYEVYERHFLRIINPILIKGFDYNDKSAIFKRGSDARNRTSVYNAVQMFFTKERMYIHGKHFDLLNDLVDSEFGGKFLYTEIGEASIVENEFVSPKGYKTTVHNFRLTKADGSDLLFISVEYGADVDKAVEEINHVLKVKKRDAAERDAAKEQ